MSHRWCHQNHLRRGTPEQGILWNWLVFYNLKRPHGGIGKLTPMQKLEKLLEQGLVCLQYTQLMIFYEGVTSERSTQPGTFVQVLRIVIIFSRSFFTRKEASSFKYSKIRYPWIKNCCYGGQLSRPHPINRRKMSCDYRLISHCVFYNHKRRRTSVQSSRLEEVVLVFIKLGINSLIHRKRNYLDSLQDAHYGVSNSDFETLLPNWMRSINSVLTYVHSFSKGLPIVMPMGLFLPTSLGRW